jgi:hypothetical protein
MGDGLSIFFPSSLRPRLPRVILSLPWTAELLLCCEMRPFPRLLYAQTNLLIIRNAVIYRNTTTHHPPPSISPQKFLDDAALFLSGLGQRAGALGIDHSARRRAQLALASWQAGCPVLPALV